MLHHHHHHHKSHNRHQRRHHYQLKSSSSLAGSWYLSSSIVCYRFRYLSSFIDRLLKVFIKKKSYLIAISLPLESTGQNFPSNWSICSRRQDLAFSNMCHNKWSFTSQRLINLTRSCICNLGSQQKDSNKRFISIRSSGMGGFLILYCTDLHYRLSRRAFWSVYKAFKSVHTRGTKWIGKTLVGDAK